MSDQSKIPHGDELPPEAAAFETKQNPPEDEGNAEAELKEVDDGER